MNTLRKFIGRNARSVIVDLNLNRFGEHENGDARAVSVLEGILNNVCECALETYPAAENSQAPGTGYTGYAHLLTPVECVACQSFKKSGEIDGPRLFSGVIALSDRRGSPRSICSSSSMSAAIALS
jgi:hypothetical protein